MQDEWQKSHRKRDEESLEADPSYLAAEDPCQAAVEFPTIAVVQVEDPFAAVVVSILVVQEEGSDRPGHKDLASFHEVAAAEVGVAVEELTDQELLRP